MTCIVAMVYNNEVFMAGDLMGSNGFTKKVYPDPKVFKNGDFVIGYTDSFRMGQLLQYNWEQPPRLEGLTDREYLQLDVIESMRGLFKLYGYGNKDGVEDIGGNFLIGYKGDIYEMQPNFSILKHEDFAAVGSGQYHAEASLALLTEDVKSPEDCISFLGKSIETAARFTTGVSGEYTWETTYVPSEVDVEEMLWDENNRMIEESLTTLDISQEDKDTFNRVKDLLDNEMMEDSVPDTSCCGCSHQEDTAVEPVEEAACHYVWKDGVTIDAENFPDEFLILLDDTTMLELSADAMKDHREVVIFFLEKVTGEKVSRKKGTKTLSLELIARATEFVLDMQD